MANNYATMTGVLRLKTVTPVIAALFGAMKLDANHPGDGEAYIAIVAESNSCSWSDVFDAAVDLCDKLGVPAEHESTVNDEDDDELAIGLAALKRLGDLFGQHGDEIRTLVSDEIGGGFDLDLEPPMQCLFAMAQLLDDGHGLTQIACETGWECSKPRLFEFGGCGEFVGKHFAAAVTSQSIHHWISAVDAFISSGDQQGAAKVLARNFQYVLDGISDKTTRESVKRLTLELLSSSDE